MNPQSRITKAEFAVMLGVHEKTLESYIKKEDFRVATGYDKGKLNGRITFDRQFATLYAAQITGDTSLRTAQDDVIDAEIVTGEELATVAPAALVRSEPVQSFGGIELAAAISGAFILPHKILLTLDEARDLSGLPKTIIKARASKVARRWLISRTELEKLCVEKVSEVSESSDKKAKTRRVKK